MGLHRNTIVVALVALSVVAVAGVVTAQVLEPVAPGFYACWDDQKGELYNVVVTKPNSNPTLDCKKDHFEVEWNGEGPEGPQGPPGLAGYEVVQVPIRPGGGGVLVPGGATHTSTVTCPNGKVALGGGAFNQGDIQQLAMLNSWPTSTGDGWNVTWLNTSPDAAILDGALYATCATVSQ